MDNNQISLHELLVFAAFSRAKGKWLTNMELADELAPRVQPRTVRHHVKRLADKGIVTQAPVFPSHRFQLAERVPQRGTSYLDRLHKAAEVFGVTL